MSQVFLSYRHVPRDEDLAEGLCAYLQGRGLRVFLDKQIQVGLEWVAEIDRQIRASNAFVVLLSEDSIRSDMVRQEIHTAHKLQRDGKMTIFPVRVGFEGELPYDLGGYLNHIQYALWHPGDSKEELFARLHSAITGGASLPVTPSTDNTSVLSLADLSAAEWKGAPLPAADPRIVLGPGIAPHGCGTRARESRPPLPCSIRVWFPRWPSAPIAGPWCRDPWTKRSDSGTREPESRSPLPYSIRIQSTTCPSVLTGNDSLWQLLNG